MELGPRTRNRTRTAAYLFFSPQKKSENPKIRIEISIRKWHLRIDISKKFGFFRIYAPIVAEKTRFRRNPKPENVPIVTGLRPTTIAKSEIREFGFFRNHECRKTLSTTIGNPLIRFGKSGTRSWSAREVGSTILVGTWNEKLDFTAYSGFFVFSDRHKSEFPNAETCKISIRKWHFRIDIFNKFGVFRVYAPIVVEPNVFRRNPKPENVPIVVGLRGVAHFKVTFTFPVPHQTGILQKFSPDT